MRKDQREKKPATVKHVLTRVRVIEADKALSGNKVQIEAVALNRLALELSRHSLFQGKFFKVLNECQILMSDRACSVFFKGRGDLSSKGPWPSQEHLHGMLTK